MNRRQFLAGNAAVFVLPFVPREKWTHDPDKSFFRSTWGRVVSEEMVVDDPVRFKDILIVWDSYV